MKRDVDGTVSMTSEAKPMRKMLLLVPFAATLIVPLYDRAAPALLGFPFFYWYLFAWIPLASLLTWLVYRGARR